MELANVHIFLKKAGSHEYQLIISSGGFQGTGAGRKECFSTSFPGSRKLIQPCSRAGWIWRFYLKGSIKSKQKISDWRAWTVCGEDIPAVTEESGTILASRPYRASMMTNTPGHISDSSPHTKQPTFQPLFIFTTPGDGLSSHQLLPTSEHKASTVPPWFVKHALTIEQLKYNTQTRPTNAFKLHFTATSARHWCVFTCTLGLKLAAGYGKRWHRV